MNNLFIPLSGPLQIRVIWCIEVCFSQKKRNSRVCTLDYIENFWLVILNPYLNSAINFEATPFVVNDETRRLLGIWRSLAGQFEFEIKIKY